MLFEGRQRAAALDRCWSIYLSLTRAFILPENFHVGFPIVAESVLITGTLQVTGSTGRENLIDAVMEIFPGAKVVQ